MGNLADEIAEIFDRTALFDALGALVEAIDPKPSGIDLENTAIGIDANVFLRIAADANAELVIDYLTGVHSKPLVLPGQAIQEYWNHHHEVATTIAKPVRAHFANLKSAVERLGEEFEDYVDRFDALIQEFESGHGAMFEPATVAKTTKFLSALKNKALIPFAPRIGFEDFSKHRKKTKTPPGFKDSGDGDFFVWVDLLFGLRKAQTDGAEFSRVVFVTNDVKADWSRNGQAHPILVAEVASLLNVPFETWTLKKLVVEIQQATSPKPEPNVVEEPAAGGAA